MDILEIWEKLPKEELQYALKVGRHSFEYPKATPYIKGVFLTPDMLYQLRFMSFCVGVHTYERDVLHDSHPAVITFYQTADGRWLFSMSESATEATFADPMPCCFHAIELAQKLAAGETADMHVTDADGAMLTVQMKPLELVVN